MQEYLFKFKNNHTHTGYSHGQVHPDLAQVRQGGILGELGDVAGGADDLRALHQQHHAQGQHHDGHQGGCGDGEGELSEVGIWVVYNI